MINEFNLQHLYDKINDGCIPQELDFFFGGENDAETSDSFDLLTNKNIKYIFNKHNDFLLSKNLPTNLLRHTKLSEEKIVLKEIQNRY